VLVNTPVANFLDFPQTRPSHTRPKHCPERQAQNAERQIQHSAFIIHHYQRGPAPAIVPPPATLQANGFLLFANSRYPTVKSLQSGPSQPAPIRPDRLLYLPIPARQG
jgi:hypothetical protein